MLKQIFKNHPKREISKKRNFSNKASPFLQWVGGKRSLIGSYEPYFPKTFKNYWEPFLGGGSVFFHLYDPSVERKYFLSDLNEELIITYNMIKDSPKEIIKILNEMNQLHSKEFYYEIRNIDRELNGKKAQKLFSVSKALQKEEVAARFIYLNRTCFNALWRVNSHGLNNVPVGRSLKKNIGDNGTIAACSEVLKNVCLRYMPYQDILSSVEENDFVYLDPPYVPLSNTSNFSSYTKEGFLKKEQMELKEFCDALNLKGAKFMLSNSNCDFVADLYLNYEQHTFSVARSLNSKGNKRSKKAAGKNEIMIRNY